MIFSPSGPGQGSLGVGTNDVTVTPTGAVAPMTLTVTVPGGVPYDTVQLYVFQGFFQYAWSVLNEGQVVASGTAPVL